MQYFGGKSRIAKHIAEEINELLNDNQPFVDLFCGSCNIISKIKNNRIMIANDKHEYLINMFWSLQNGWIPPSNISEEEYYKIKANANVYKDLAGFVGFACSFSGKWWGGYARNKRGDKFCLQSKRSLLKKFETLKNVEFVNDDFENVIIPKSSLVYCDIPYFGSTQYSSKETGIFDYERFYNWVRKNKENFTVYISEYRHNIPDDFKTIWEFNSNKEIRNKDNKREETVEVLITLQ